jgi:UDP-N-acetylmuramate: L-alanyl-gamma-D-glutamyl-meso-diaminopimelate ligase
VRVYDDFAHHPTAVAETIAALKLAHPARRLWAIFEPRSASACMRVFQADYLDAFERADEVIVAPVFRTRLAEDSRLSPGELVEDLRARGVSAHAPGSTAEIVEHVSANAGPSDLIVVMSNGGFDGIHERLLDALRARAS